MSGVGTVPIRSDDDLKTKVAQDLIDKGVEPSSANYLAELFVKSEKGKTIVKDGEITILGSCNLFGFSPG